MEIANAKATGVKFFVSMPNSQQKSFFEAIVNGTDVLQVYQKLDTEQAEASVPKDQAMIRKKIEEWKRRKNKFLK